MNDMHNLKKKKKKKCATGDVSILSKPFSEVPTQFPQLIPHFPSGMSPWEVSDMGEMSDFLHPSVVALASGRQMGHGGVRFETQRAASQSSLLSIRPLQSMTPHWLAVTASEQKQETCTRVCASFHTLVPLMEVTLNLSCSNSLPQQPLQCLWDLNSIQHFSISLL